ncbi:hypothetical protein QM012_005728 [Aureobasidium pullulans]|uniref:Autophagy-related protein 16 domain-containing protein n=1 Tax=Aureobasidium pullulans TaxID=5580 RepID=A0ABR0TQK2_AURPU
MVTPADMIRELTLTNKHLIKKNETLKLDNHNLKVTNDILKNKAATDQAVMNAALTIKNLEAYNQTLENENQHLREQLEHCTEKKMIDEKLEILRKEVKVIDEELARRMEEMGIMQELDEKIKLLKQIKGQEDGQKENESDSEDVFVVHTKEGTTELLTLRSFNCDGLPYRPAHAFPEDGNRADSHSSNHLDGYDISRGAAEENETLLAGNKKLLIDNENLRVRNYELKREIKEPYRQLWKVAAETHNDLLNLLNKKNIALNETTAEAVQSAEVVNNIIKENLQLKAENERLRTEIKELRIKLWDATEEERKMNAARLHDVLKVL